MAPQRLWAELVDCFVNVSIASELAGWLQELGLSPNGTIAQLSERLHRHAASLVLPAETAPRQTIFYLTQYSPDILGEICQELGIPSEGSREMLIKRIYREVGIREGWLRPSPDEIRHLFQDALFPMLRHFGILTAYPADSPGDLFTRFGEEHGCSCAPLAYGSALIAVVVPDFLQEAQSMLFCNELKNRGLDLV